MMSPYDPTFDFNVYIGQSDLHFTVQWFCFSDLAFLSRDGGTDWQGGGYMCPAGHFI